MTTVLDPHADTPQNPPETPLTFEQFLAWVEEDDYAEWVDGEVVFKGAERATHQDLLGFLAGALGSYVEDHDAGEFITSPYLMKLARSARAPDITFIAKAKEHRLQEYFLDGPADIAIEIVSSSSATRDRGTKYGEYEAGGVREYWIIDLDTKRADFLVLDAVVFCPDCGWRKPARQIFDHTLDSLGATPGQCVFVGDDPRWDVAGPLGVGMEAVLIDRKTQTLPDVLPFQREP